MKNYFGCAANRESERLISTPTYIDTPGYIQILFGGWGNQFHFNTVIRLRPISRALILMQTA
jgi:hypothetical protein